ncbi:MAG: TolC family protein [Bacteroidia bacterium]
MRTNYLFFLFLFLLPFSGFTQGSKKIKLEEAIKMGLEQSRSLKIAESKVTIAGSKFVELKDMVLPSVGVSAGYARLSDIPAFTFQLNPSSPPVTLFPVILNNYSTRASVNESVFNGFRLKNGIASQQYLLEATKLDYEKDKEDIKFNIVNAYFNLYKVQISKGIIEKSLAQADQRLKEIRTMEQQGLVLHNEELRAELQRSNMELTELDINNNLQVANYNFGVLIGLPEGAEVEIDSAELFQKNDFKAFQEYMQTSLSKRSDLKAADLRKKASELNLKVVRGNMFPNLNIGANYYYADPNQRYIPPVAEFHNTWDIGINLNWNLTALYTNKHQRDEAQSQILQSSAFRDQIADAVHMEVNQDFIGFQQSIKKTEVAARSVKLAQDNYRNTLSRYSNHVALLSDLLDAEVLLLQANLNLAYSKADTQIAYHHLLKSTGSN